MTKQLRLTRAGFSTYPSNGSGMLIKCSRSNSSISTSVNYLCSGCSVSAQIARQRSAIQALSSPKEQNRLETAYIKIRLRLSCCETCMCWYTPPMSNRSSLQSN